ncbi:hypothetical protein [Brevundimonas nasdae]|uniref:hypothetical protein n=1 Tax=Brevundimonas nasdae TaxID=172043 RepID=UPI003F68D2C2
MHPQTDLSLLLKSLSQLSRSPYFNKGLEEHTRTLIDVVEHVLTASPKYDDVIVRMLADKVWLTHRYLQGSTTKESPYEIEYCLRFALAQWLPFKCLVTTALTDEKDFHLQMGDPWEFVAKTITRFDKPLPESRLVFIGVPRLYKDMPLFCCALYHELGHFVDVTGKITAATLLLDPIPEAIPDKFHANIICHRREHFADLFAACYVGSAIGDMLHSISPDAGISETHPATAKRLDVIRSFLADEDSEIVGAFQTALTQRGFPPLAKRFEIPNIESSFDDIRPCVLVGEQQLHGMFPAGWSYLAKALNGDGAPWTKGAKPVELTKIINDLAEKSIRNASIRQLWAESK